MNTSSLVQEVWNLCHTLRDAMAVLDTLFDRPIFRSGDFVQRSGIPKQSALPFLRTLREAGILQVLRESSGRRSAVLAFRDLLNCAEGREIF